MVLCGDGCVSCCDFCIHVKHNKIIVDEMECTGGPIGCLLHKDQEHQDVAYGCVYCEYYHCFNAAIEKNNRPAT